MHAHQKLDLSYNEELTALPPGLCALMELEELDLNHCRLTTLPEGVGALTGIKKLDLS
jgi:Leucine-rich repeat (LRR) protein